MSKKFTTEEFIKKSKEVYGENVYDYSLVNYVNSETKITLIDIDSNKIFTIRPTDHLNRSGYIKHSNRKIKKLLNDFIEKSDQIYFGKYDYSLVNYTSNKSKVAIICPLHGIFYQTPNEHTSGCPKCALENNKYKNTRYINKFSKNGKIKKKYTYTTEEFITRANKIHDNFFDYSKTIYTNESTKIIIVCPIHGEFLQRPDSHLKTKSPCPECRNIYNYTTEDFIEKAKKIHGDLYDYSSTVYKKFSHKLTIICKIHGPFLQSPEHHLKYKCGCPKCAKTKPLTQEEFIERCKKIHFNKYDYSLTIYKNTISKIIVICPFHGIFEQTAEQHLRGHGCKKCKISRGEKIIENFLIQNKILFIHENKFDDCINPKTKRKLQFDFFIPSKNCCVEFDGKHHFEERFYHHSSLKDVQFKDSIKNKYCEDNNIKLIRIPYWKSQNIEEILKKELNL